MQELQTIIGKCVLNLDYLREEKLNEYSDGRCAKFQIEKILEDDKYFINEKKTELTEFKSVIETLDLFDSKPYHFKFFLYKQFELKFMK